MDDERVGARIDHLLREREKRRLRVLIVDADPAFDRDREIDGVLHRAHAIGDERGPQHQTGAERAVLHPVGRTADVEIDLVIVEGRGDRRRAREIRRLRAAKLQRERALERIEAEEPLAIAVDHGARRQHLRIEPGAARHQPVQIAAVTIRPIHHGRDGESNVLLCKLFCQV